jgi:Cytochrome oxidase c assembly
VRFIREDTMGLKRQPKFKYLDLAHRGVVVTCIGLTLYGSWLLSHRVYRYFTVIKPNRDLEESRIIEVKIKLLEKKT